jgi:hypothetical protein
MTPEISISSISIDNHPGDWPNVRTLVKVVVEDIKGSRMTLLSFESDGDDRQTRRDHLVLTPNIAEGLADALRVVLERRGLRSGREPR